MTEAIDGLIMVFILCALLTAPGWIPLIMRAKNEPGPAKNEPMPGPAKNGPARENGPSQARANKPTNQPVNRANKPTRAIIDNRTTYQIWTEQLKQYPRVKMGQPLPVSQLERPRAKMGQTSQPAKMSQTAKAVKRQHAERFIVDHQDMTIDALTLALADTGLSRATIGRIKQAVMGAGGKLIH